VFGEGGNSNKRLKKTPLFCFYGFLCFSLGKEKRLTPHIPMNRKEAQQMLDNLLQRLAYYRQEKIITAYPPLEFDLGKRIEEIEKAVNQLQYTLEQSQAETIALPNLQRFYELACMEVQQQDKQAFAKLSGVFLQDCQNALVNSTINAKNVHISNIIHYHTLSHTTHTRN
jgi:hypothetical protein